MTDIPGWPEDPEGADNTALLAEGLEGSMNAAADGESVHPPPPLTTNPLSFVFQQVTCEENFSQEQKQDNCLKHCREHAGDW